MCQLRPRLSFCEFVESLVEVLPDLIADVHKFVGGELLANCWEFVGKDVTPINNRLLQVS